MNTYYLISGGILGLGFLISLFFILWGKRKQTKGIDGYKRIRDKLTVREPEPEKVESSGGFHLGLGNLIGGFVVILVGASLLPVVSEQVGVACQDMAVANVSEANGLLCESGATDTMFGLVTLFFALAVATTAIGLAVSGLNRCGLV